MAPDVFAVCQSFIFILFPFWLFSSSTLVVRVHPLELYASYDWLACMAAVSLQACR